MTRAYCMKENKIFDLLDRALLPFYDYPVPGRTKFKLVIRLVSSILRTRQINHTFSLMKIVILYSAAFFYLPLSIIVFYSRYRFFIAELSQIGTIYYVDLMARSIELSPSNKKYILIHKKHYQSNNNLLIRKYGEYFILLDGYILRAILLPFTCFPWLIQNTHKFNHPTLDNAIYKLEEHPRILYSNSVDMRKNPLIHLNQTENKYCVKKIMEIGLNANKIITIHIRDSGFYGENFDSLRNANIFDYKKIVSYVIDKEYSVVRLGRKSRICLKEWEKEFDGAFFDYCCSDMQSDLMDIFLASKCFVNIGTISGMSYIIPSVFMRPTFFSNTHNPSQTLGFNELDMTIFKKYRNIKNNKLIPLKDYFDKYYDTGSDVDLRAAGLSIENNTIDELFSSFVEFLDQVENNIADNKRSREIITKYVKKHHASYGTKANFSSLFLSKLDTIYD